MSEDRTRRPWPKHIRYEPGLVVPDAPDDGVLDSSFRQVEPSRAMPAPVPLVEQPAMVPEEARALVEEHWDRSAKFARALRRKLNYESVMSSETAVGIGHTALVWAAPRWSEGENTAQFSTVLHKRIRGALQDEARRPPTVEVDEEDSRLVARTGQSAEDEAVAQDPEESFWWDLKTNAWPSQYVQAFVDLLTKPQQDAIHLVTAQGFTHEQAAASMGITRQTLETHLRKAARALAAPGAAEDPEMPEDERIALEDAKRRIRARIEAG